MMRTLVVGAVLAAVALVPVSSAAADDANPLGNAAHGGGHAEADGHTVFATATAYVDPHGHVHPLQEGAPDDAPSPYEYRLGPVIRGFCGTDAQGRPIDLIGLDQRLIADGPNARWALGPTYCSSAGTQPLDLGNIAAQVATVTQTLTPPAPTVRVQPSGKTLIGNPTVFSGSDLADLTPPALVNPLSGRQLQLTVQPSTWTWDFGDGSPKITTQGPPRPYTRGTDMSELLTHTYQRAGDVTATVTVTWTASYTISGIAGARQVTTPVTSTSRVPVLVRQARTQLVSH